MNNFYTAAEAMKRLRLKKSTFYDLIERGDIPKGIMLPLRRHALYPKATIDKLADEQDKILEEYGREPERLKLMIPTKEDFQQIVEIDQLLYPGETWMTTEELQERLPYNPEVTHVLKDTTTNTVVGYISMSPLKEEILEKLIDLQIDETSLRAEHFTPYTPDKPTDCYVVSIGARPGPGIVQQLYAGKLIQALTNYLLELLEQGDIIRRIYTVATTKQGERLAQGLQFTPITTSQTWQSDYEDFRHPYVLNLEDKESKSRLTQEYQKHLRNRERRMKRYARQAKPSETRKATPRH